MSKSIIQITEEHGKEMRRIALEHSLEMAKIYQAAGEPIDKLIEHLEQKLKEGEDV